MIDIERLKKEKGPAGARWISIFCTSDPEDRGSIEEAEQLGYALARSGYVVVTGGYGAAMEGANRGASRAGGFTVGVTCSIFSREPNAYLNERIVTDSLLDRLETLLRLSDGYVAAKGGTGTLAELALAWEYINKRIVPRRPLVILGEFWAVLPEIMRNAQAAPGVSIGRAPDSITVARDIEDAVRILGQSFKAWKK